MKKFKNTIILLGIFFCLTFTLISQNVTLYSETFENLSNFNNWTQEKNSGNASWTLNNGLPYGDFDFAFEGQSNACFASYNYNNDQTMLISPIFDLSTAIYPILRFNLLQPVWGLDQDELLVLYRSDISNEWTLLNIYNYNINSWTEILVALPDASETYQIAFSAKSGYGYGIGLDNILISNGETCDMIKNFNFINIKETSILISWENQENNTCEIEYGPIGYLPGNGIKVNNINEQSTHVNNLNPGEAYSLYIRVYCSNGISDWTGPYDFYTECNIGQQIPYTESFENIENPLECWRVIYPSNTHNAENDLVVVNETSYSGQNSVRFSSYKVGNPYDQYLISPNISFEDTLELSFKYRAINGSKELFKVGFSTNSDNPLNAVNWLDTVSNANADWKTYKTLVPPGSSNFVLHYCSIFEYYLFIDDININYTTSPSPIDLSYPINDPINDPTDDTTNDTTNNNNIQDIPEAVLVAVDSIIYVCSNTESNITAELEFINTGKVIITAGSTITYSIVIESNNEIIHIEKILTNDLLPGETYSFIDKLDVNNINDLDYLSIQLTKNWKSNNSKSDYITIASVFNNITFNNESNGIIEVSDFPELISAEFFSNIEQYNIDYLWNDNTSGSSMFVNNEGIYTLTVSTELCQISKSVNVIKNTDEFQNQTQYDVYPNPSQDGQINLATNSETIVNVIIYDAIGRNVYATTLSNIVKQVDLRFLAAGIYNVAFVENDNVELKRLYIE